LLLYHGLTAYTFVDFATGACCFLVLIGLAGLIARFPWPARMFGLVGLYSYGIYLIHQPYVIWLGLRIRELPIWSFVLVALGTLAVLSFWGIALEKSINMLTSYISRIRAKPALSSG
jgi:peptidoglycan/LPS O-acetylase OafA/YrhL